MYLQYLILSTLKKWEFLRESWGKQHNCLWHILKLASTHVDHRAEEVALKSQLLRELLLGVA